MHVILLLDEKMTQEISIILHQNILIVIFHRASRNSRFSIFIYLLPFHLLFECTFYESKILSSPAGNRTPVSRVTGGDTHHYTTEDVYNVCRVFTYYCICKLNT